MSIKPNDPPAASVAGIMIRYCVPGQSQPQDVWIDMDAVHGLAWDPPGKPWPSIKDPFDHGKASINGNNKIAQASEPSCPGHKLQVTLMTGTGTGSGVCWWDGNQWICCD